jgi:membrane protein involved in colicin uptake
MYLQAEKNARRNRQLAIVVTIALHVALVAALMTDFGGSDTNTRSSKPVTSIGAKPQP